VKISLQTQYDRKSSPDFAAEKFSRIQTVFVPAFLKRIVTVEQISA